MRPMPTDQDAPCTGCSRTPLVGELMHLCDDGSELCELCAIDRAEAVIQVARVRSPEARDTVRLLGAVGAQQAS